MVFDEQNTFSQYAFNRVSELADTLYAETVKMISQNTDKLTKIAELLIERETVSGEEILNAIK